MFRICVAVIVYTSIHPLAYGQAENPRHIKLKPGQRLETLKQHWTHEESNWFYNAAQGSRLLPYDWFVHLEQPDSNSPFNDADHIRGLGYIPRGPSAGNPDGLPIGFAKDAPYDDGMEGLGVTCAACHTGQIDYRGITYLIDGGPSLGDMEQFMKRLTDALDNTSTDDAKFARFADAVLPTRVTDRTKRDLRSAVMMIARQRRNYNNRNFPHEPSHRFGYGRVDAFGAIFNEVSTAFLGIESNASTPNAPVSFPCLWDAPQHDRVQWNGGAENRTSFLGIALFGTKDVGALGRNAGEVLGVFGHVDINRHEFLLPRRYESTVNKPQLIAIEETLTDLWSPEWPVALGEINKERRDRGELIYKDNCMKCHEPIVRDAANRTVEGKLSDVGTDQQMLINFGRTARTGILEGRRKTLLAQERFGEVEPVGVILKHVVERAILNDLDPRVVKQALAGKLDGVVLDINELNPGFQSTATVSKNGRESTIGLESIQKDGNKLRIAASKSDLLELARELALDGGGLESLGASNSVVKLNSAADVEETPVGELENASASLGYKARPLNGIWATAPYLHNGSVPTLAQLLNPAKRQAKFHVGSKEFDPVNVGFVDDPAFPVYDTTDPVMGNDNSGHEFGADLEQEDRLDLIEYLKSL